MTVTIGISTKAYLGPDRTRAWVRAVCDTARGHHAVRDGRVAVFVAPTTAVLESTIETARGSGVVVAAQDVSRHDAGPYTGEVGASFLAELGVGMVEVGHAERRRLFGETDAVVAEKCARVQAAGMLPLLCVGEPSRVDPAAAAAFCAEQASAAGKGPVLIAYEPVWAIGAEHPAPADHVRAVVRALRPSLPAGTAVLYGGSAGPGLLGTLRPELDGLFLGRFAHDPAAVATVLDEAAALA